MHKYTVRGAELLPKLKADLDISKFNKTTTVKVDLGNNFIIEYTKSHMGAPRWKHIANGKIYVNDKAPKLLNQTLLPYIQDYDKYRSDAVRSSKIVAMFSGEEEVSNKIMIDEVV